MEITPANIRLGWIGVGVMGQRMCGHLLDAGFKITVHNRTKQKATPLLDQGAEWRETVAEVAEAADVVFTMVGYPDDVRQVYLAANGLLAASRSGTILVDMTTSQPSLAKEIAQQAASQDLISIDAPVSGGDLGARDATLSIMIGGPADACASLQPCWEAMGRTIVHQGEAGMGQHAKMVNQTLIASGMIGVCEALLYGYRAGLNLQQVLESVASGAAGSWALSKLGPRILANDFEPGFFCGTLYQRHGHRPGRGAPHESLDARLGTGQSTLYCSRRTGSRSQRHPSPAVDTRRCCGDRLAKPPAMKNRKIPVQIAAQ